MDDKASGVKPLAQNALRLKKTKKPKPRKIVVATAPATTVESRPGWGIAAKLATGARSTDRIGASGDSVAPHHGNRDNTMASQFKDSDTAARTDPSRPSRRTSSGKLYGQMVETQEVETLCSNLGMLRKDVWRLRTQFNDEDTESTNTITQAAFFYLIQEEKRSLTKTIFRLAHIPLSQPKLTFDEYLCCVCTFASFTEVELLKFFYEVYNEDCATGGAMGESDILKLGRELQDMNSAYGKNVTIATKRMASNRDLISHQTLLTFQDFERLSRQNKVAFYPLLQMQRNVRMGNLGEAYWVEKTREKLEIQQMLVFMAHHNGKQPAVDWKAKVLGAVFHRETSAVRVRRRAKLMYDAQYRQLCDSGK